MNKIRQELAKLLSDYAQYKNYQDMNLLDFLKWMESISRHE